VFKSADDWLTYQADFGGGADPFGSMMGHIAMMARDTAAMEVLGPNPSGTIEWLKQIIEKEARQKTAGKDGRLPGDNPQDHATHMQHRIDAVWNSIRGQLNTPVHGKAAAVGAGVRGWITSSVLGSASISAISDIGTSAVTRAFSGVNASRAFTDIVRAMTPTTRREAVAAGLILDNAMHVFQSQARYVGTIGGPKWIDYLGDRVLTLSGLTPWTQAARHAFGLAFMREAAEQAGKSFDALPDLFRSRFAEYGIDAKAWDWIRKSKTHKLGDGVAILRPNEISAQNRRLAERYLEMVLTETEYAVPSGAHRSRTALIDQNRPGNVPGEILRSFAQFKSFGAVFALLHGQRIARMLMARETRMTGIGYASALTISSIVFGGLALQLKQVVAGRDPRPMADPAFFAAAFLQGGGLGIYGDFFFSDLNRYGGGLAPAIGGPVVDRVGDFTNLTLGNLVELGQGKDTKFGRELVKFARGNVPGGNVWYTRLAWERGLLDNLQYVLDPDANKAFKRQQQFWKRDFGQGYWFAPGTGAPQRGPDLGKAFTAPEPVN